MSKWIAVVNQCRARKTARLTAVVVFPPPPLPSALRLEANIKALRAGVQPELRILGALGNFHKETDSMARDTLARVSPIFGALVFGTRIHQSDSVGRAVGCDAPFLITSPLRREADEYQLLTQEVIDRATQR